MQSLNFKYVLLKPWPLSVSNGNKPLVVTNIAFLKSSLNVLRTTEHFSAFFPPFFPMDFGAKHRLLANYPSASHY